MSENTQVVGPALRAINARPRALARKVHGSAFSHAGEPDIDAVVDGVAYKLEAKLPGGKPSKVQSRRLRQWAETGAVVGVIYSAAEAIAVIDGDPEARKTCFGRIE